MQEEQTAEGKQNICERGDGAGLQQQHVLGSNVMFATAPAAHTCRMWVLGCSCVPCPQSSLHSLTSLMWPMPSRKMMDSMR